MKSKIQIQKRTEFILGFLESDENHFYSQILNGSFGYLIYYFCYELLDINFTSNTHPKEKQILMDFHAEVNYIRLFQMILLISQ